MNFRPKGQKLDRGRASRGTSWCYVNRGSIIEYELGQRLGFAKLTRTDAVQFFQSHREAKRWIALGVQEKAGIIRNLRRQVPFDLLAVRPDGLKEKVGSFRADFVYDRQPEKNPSTWVPVVEDVKGHREDLFIWKARHFAIQYGFPILET